MTFIQSSDSLARLASMVLERWGLQFQKERHRDLGRGVDAAAKSLGLPVKTYLEMVLREPAHPSRNKLLSILAEKLTVGESYFFRETRSIHALDEAILPGLIHKRLQEGDRRLRLWSAGCATGEEPYTLSILLDRVFRRLGESREEWDVVILATDINREFLRRARLGVYREWSFRTAPPWLKEQYFEATDDKRWRVRDAVREPVRFRVFNLCDADSSLETDGGMDVILCRNVLIYFSYERMTCALKGLRSRLASGGRLITSPTESAHVLETNIFIPCRELDLLAFCKPGSAPIEPPEAARPDEFPISYAEPEETDAPPAGWAETGTGTTEPAAVDVEHGPQDTSGPALPPPTVEEAGGVLEAAEAAIAHGDPEGAEAHARRYLDQLAAGNGGQTARAKALIAQSLSSRGRLEEALQWAEGAVQSESMNPEHRYHQGVILQELGRLDDAAVSMERALYLDPALPMAHFSLGILARRKGNETAAQRHFTRLLTVLDQLEGDEPVPLSEGLSAARLRELVESLLLSR